MLVDQQKSFHCATHVAITAGNYLINSGLLGGILSFAVGEGVRSEIQRAAPSGQLTAHASAVLHRTNTGHSVGL